MIREEFEERERRLNQDVDAAYQEFNRARDHWDQLCRERRDLHWQWHQQHKNKGEW